MAFPLACQLYTLVIIHSSTWLTTWICHSCHFWHSRGGRHVRLWFCGAHCERGELLLPLGLPAHTRRGSWRWYPLLWARACADCPLGPHSCGLPSAGPVRVAEYPRGPHSCGLPPCWARACRGVPSGPTFVWIAPSGPACRGVPFAFLEIAISRYGVE